jgi:hypothetical protein
MPEASLTVAALLETAAALLFAYVGLYLWRRRTSGDARWAGTMFAMWWFGLAGNTFIGAIQRVAGAAGITNLAFHVTLNHVSLLVLCIALAGLLYYLTYLFTGWKRALIPISGFYVLYYFAIIYYVTASEPAGVNVQPWNVTIEYAALITGPFFTALLLLLVLPQIIGALAYFTIYFRVNDPTQRYRIVIVSWSIIIWFASALVGSVAGFSGHDWWQLFTRILGLAAALAIFLAYEPPKWVRRHYGITSVREEVS